MRIDIMEFKPKNNKIKIGIMVIFALFLVAIFSMLGIHYAKIYVSKNNKYKNKSNISNQIVSEKEQFDNIVEREQVKKALTPIYSENAKRKLSNIYNLNSKVAYLTFDDGPSQAVTPLILDVLKEENIKATFFVLGINVKNNPDILKRTYLEGHYIANHGYSHNYSKIYASKEKVLEEYNKTEKVIKKAIGNNDYSSYLFRFPGGFEGR